MKYISFVFLAVWIWIGSAGAQTGTPFDAYLEGLTALQQGRFAAAEQRFSEAVAGDDETADFHLALAVSRILQEENNVDTPLSRASRLDPGLDQVKLWRYAANVLFKPGGSYPSRPPYEVLQPYTRPLIDALHLYGTIEVPRDRPEARRRFPQIAATFAKAQMVQPAIWPHMLELASKFFRKRDYATACPIVTTIRSGQPQNPRYLYLSASCSLYRKDYGQARDTYTQLLQKQPNYAYALLGRARAAAMMGDTARARDDFAAAEKIDPKSAAAYRASVIPVIEKQERERGRTTDSLSLAQLLARLKAAEADGQAIPKLVKLAIPLVQRRKEVNWNKEEIYSDRVAELQQAINQEPNDPDALVALAAFYLRPLAPKQIKLSGGRTVTAMLPLRNPWRVSGGKYVYAVPWVFRGEPEAAKPLLVQALKLHPGHPGAVRWNAMRLRMIENLDAMQPYVRQGLKNDPLDLDLVRLHLDYHTAVAANLNAQATALRTPRTHYEDRADGRYRVTTYPSAADKRNAAQLDQQAQQNRRQAYAPLKYLAGALKGKPQAKPKYDLANAVYYYWIGKLETAAGAVNTALKSDPTYLDALEFMIDLATGTGTFELRDKWQGLLDSWMGTSARVQLRPVFGLIEKSKYRSALKQLDTAETTDLGASLVSAYRMVAAEGLNNAADVMHTARLLMALEGAKAAVSGRSLLADSKGALLSGDVGLSLLARLYGARALSRHNSQSAIGLADAGLKIAERVTIEAWDDPIATTDMPGTRKGGETVRGLVISLHQLLAQIWQRQGDPNKAIVHNQRASAERQNQTRIQQERAFEKTVRQGSRK